MAFHQFPYTNFHDLNIDWVLEKINSLESAFTTNVKEAVAEAIAKVFVDITYDEESETITFDIGTEE